MGGPRKWATDLEGVSLDCSPAWIGCLIAESKLRSIFVIRIRFTLRSDGGDRLKPFLSSTFLDLVEEREAVLESLRKMRLVTHAMEDFIATPNPPLVTALEHLRDADLMLLVIGFKAGTLLSDGSGSTYTSAEYDELLRLGKETLVFVKQKKRWCERRTSWHNEERDPAKKKALDAFKAKVT